MIFKSINQLSKENIFELFEDCTFFLKNSGKEYDILKSKQIASIFFEPSTRTQLSFQKSVLSLGGKLLTISDIAQTRSNPNDAESLYDSLKVISYYCDCLVLRSRNSLLDVNLEEIMQIENFVNAGDGRNEHPLQALGDCWLISQVYKNFDFRFGFIGDCTARVFRSVFLLLAKLGVSEFHYYSTNLNEMPIDILSYDSKIKIVFHDDLEGFMNSVDVVEVIPYKIPFNTPITRKDPKEITITDEVIKKYNPNLILLHPGPRNFELSPTVDKLKNSLFFEQARTSTFMKMSLFKFLFSH